MVPGRVPRLSLEGARGAEPIARAVLAIGVGAAAILWPGRSLAVVVGLAGLALVVLGLYSGALALRGRDLRSAGDAALTVVLGLALLAVRQWAGALLVVGLAAVVAVRGLVDLYGALVRGRAAGSWWLGLRGLGQLLAAAALVILGELAVLLVLSAIGAAWILAGGIFLWRRVGPGASEQDEPVTLEETPEIAEAWLRRRDMGDAARNDVVERLIFQGSQYRRRVRRFIALMGFSTAIAAFGIQTDSTAVVIGAMLVAPLMTPILATSASLLLGRPARVASSLALVGLGVVIGIGVAFLIARYAPGLVDVTENSQVTSRTAPTLLDLMIALAAGGAGGYAVSRPDVSDSLPGVAIAVALVPPLAVVGITLSAGEYSLAAGALLLFATNLVGIILASAAVFLFVGFLPWSEMQRSQGQLRRSLATVLVALAVIAIPLSVTGDEILSSAADYDGAVAATERWLDGHDDLELVQLELDGSAVSIAVVGAAAPTDVDGLAEDIAAEIDRDVEVGLSFIPRQELTARATAR